MKRFFILVFLLVFAMMQAQTVTAQPGKRNNSSDTSATVLPMAPPQKRFVLYSEGLGVSFGVSGNAEVRILGRRDGFFGLYGRAGLSVSYFQSLFGMLGLHATFGRARVQPDVGVILNTITHREIYAFSLGLRYTGKKGLFIRPAFTPFYYGSLKKFFASAGVSAGYAWSCKKKKKP